MDETGISWSTDLSRLFHQPDGFVASECSPNTPCTTCLGSGYENCSNFTDPRTGATFKYWYPEDSTTQYLYETYPNVMNPIEGVTNEHFIVWMRVSALPSFRKLYGRIDSDVKAPATLVFNITSNYYVGGFGGKKSLVITTSSPIGNRNGVLGGVYMLVGGASLVAGLFILSRFQERPR
ncbi:unnamed protein product, partial [Choristocarpus tenellus]